MAGVVLNLLTILLQNVFSPPGRKTPELFRGFNVYTWIITANTVSGPCDMLVSEKTRDHSFRP